MSPGGEDYKLPPPLWIREMSANDPLRKCRKDSDDTKTRVSPASWEQHGSYLLLSMRGPAYRRHDSCPGFRGT
jgi:hypothetical protein